MVVHVEDAPIAARAVMAPFGFEYVAHQTVSTALILRIAQVEAPEDWNLTWVRCHRLDEWPDEHYEEYVEEGEQNNYSRIIYRKKVLENEQIRLTFGFREPNNECVSIIDEGNDARDQHDKDVANYHGGSYGKSSRHYMTVQEAAKEI